MCEEARLEVCGLTHDVNVKFTGCCGTQGYASIQIYVRTGMLTVVPYGKMNLTVWDEWMITQIEACAIERCTVVKAHQVEDVIIELTLFHCLVYTLWWCS